MRRRRFHLLRLGLLLLAILALVALSTTGPSQADGGPSIHLQRATFDPLGEQPALPPNLTVPVTKADEGGYRLVQFVGPVLPEWKAQAAGAGAELLEYIPDYAFIARLAPGAETALRALSCVRWVGPYHPAYRLSEDLDPWLDGGKGEELPDLRVRLLAGVDVHAAEQALAALGGTVTSRSSRATGSSLTVRLPATALAQAAAIPGVAWIEPIASIRLYNDVGRSIMRVETAWSRVPGLYGAGQIVAIADTGLDTGSTGTLAADFRGRLVAAYSLGRSGDWSDDNGHGTHVAGSVLGNGVLSGSDPETRSYTDSFAGVAPEASLVFQSLLTSGGGLSVPSDLNNLFLPAYNDGARVHTNSWGQAEAPYGIYNSYSRDADEFTWAHPDMTILFAAGNNGVDANADGIIDGDGIGWPGTAKNVITVGASESFRVQPFYAWGDSWRGDYPALPVSIDGLANNTGGMAAFSSRGPTDDGRVKPDLVAPGTNIISARSHDPAAGTGWGVYPDNEDYVYMGGTSMATPLTAGAAALVRDWYNDRQGVVNPSAALIKATLINGASPIAPGQYGTGSTQEVPNALPNNVTGWGRVNLAASVAPSAPTQLWYDDYTAGLNTGGQVIYYLSTSSATVTPADEALPGKLVVEGAGQSPSQPAQAFDIKPGALPPTFTIPLSIELPKDAPPVPEAPDSKAAELVLNGGFETGSLSSWITYNNPSVTSSQHHSGSYSAQLTDGNGQQRQLYQALSFPAGITSATLRFWLRIDSAETYRGYDYLWAGLYRVSGGTVALPLGYLDVVDRPSGWGQAVYVFDARALDIVRGGQFYLLFGGVTDSSLVSSIYLDDISLQYDTASPANTRPFRVTLAWTDYPGNEGSGKTLVNDLDLEVIAPGGAHYYGNNATAGNPDSLNNVETVRIADGAPAGVWQVIVKGRSVPMGPQPFAIVVSGSDLTEGEPPDLDNHIFLPCVLR